MSTERRRGPDRRGPGRPRVPDRRRPTTRPVKLPAEIDDAVQRIAAHTGLTIHAVILVAIRRMIVATPIISGIAKIPPDADLT